MAWLRLHTSVLDNPEIQRLPAHLFKLLINIWCVTRDNDGAVKDVVTLAFRLRQRADRCQRGVTALAQAGLLEVTEDGIVPYNWAKFQYKSDDSTARVDRFRKRAAPVTVTPPEQNREQKQSRAEQTRGRAGARDAAAGQENPTRSAEDTLAYLRAGRIDMIGMCEMHLGGWRDYWASDAVALKRDYAAEELEAVFAEAGRSTGTSLNYVAKIAERRKREQGTAGRDRVLTSAEADALIAAQNAGASAPAGDRDGTGARTGRAVPRPGRVSKEQSGDDGE